MGGLSHSWRMPGMALLPAVLAALLAVLAQPAFAAGVPLPEPPRGEGQRCVEPVDVMRREHMNFLLHQRDRTVHQAYREPRHSLRGCIECHVQRDAVGNTVPVDAPGQFCAECHTYAAVSMDCFECHATTPDSGRKRGGGEVRQ